MVPSFTKDNRLNCREMIKKGSIFGQIVGGNCHIFTNRCQTLLAIAGVTWFKWARFILPLIAIQYVIDATFVLVSIYLFIWT